MKKFFSSITAGVKHAVKNPITTITGVGALTAAGSAVVANPATLADPMWWAAISAGLGLVAGKDANVTGALEATKNLINKAQVK